MNILDAMDRIETVQRTLEITSPIAARVKEVYTLGTAAGKVPNSFPCFLNFAELLPLQFGSSLLRRTYRVRMVLLVKDADPNRAARIALAFEHQLLQGFAADATLNGACTNIGPIEGINDRIEPWQLPGLDYTMDVLMAEAQDYEV